MFYYGVLSNIAFSVSTMVGSPSSGSVACWWEAIVSNIFGLSGLLWNTTYALAFYEKFHSYHLPIAYVHAICWGLPILVTFLPLLQVTYGKHDYSGNWCFIISSSHGVATTEVIYWYWISYFCG
jgi:hypothetical protein